MKRSFFAILAAFCSLAFSACSSDEPNKEGEITVESLSKEDIRIIVLKPGASQTARLTGGNGTFVVKSQNPAVAEVTHNPSNNEITAKGLSLGDCDVYVSSGSKSASFLVRVEVDIQLSHVSSSDKTMNLKVGQTMTSTLSGGNAAYYIKKNSDPKVAEVRLDNENQLHVKALAKGDTEVMIISGGKSYLLVVRVAAE